jgi:hypothetical protein
LGVLEVDGGGLALLAALDLVAQFLAFPQAAEPGHLDRRDVHENVFGAVIGLNEAITLLRIEPFDRTNRHRSLHVFGRAADATQVKRRLDGDRGRARESVTAAADPRSIDRQV